MPLTLPRMSWGNVSASRHVLLIHGLGSSAALMWRIGAALASDGWHATAVDLRGHGSAPRSLDYSLSAFGADVCATTPHGHGTWDAVIGHSLGAAASVIAAADNPVWTRRLVLIDPAIHLDAKNAAIVRRSQQRAFDDNRLDAVRDEHPHWHPQDIELKVDAVNRASRWAVEQTSSQNTTWDVRDEAARLTIQTHIIGADARIYSLFTGTLANRVLTSNPLITMSIVTDAGHSPHRDNPSEFLRQLREALA